MVVDFVVVGLLGCGVMVGLGVVINIGGVICDDIVVVIGCGGVGDVVIVGVVLVGVKWIIVVDIDDMKFDWVCIFGVIYIVNVCEVDVV